MGFFDKLKKLNDKQKELQSKKMKMVAQLYHLEGLPNQNQGEKISLELDPEEEKLYMNKAGFGVKKEDAIVLDMNKVVFVEKATVSEITEKNKSVIGRAAVGSLLGPIGAVIGGISGVGNKKKQKDSKLLIIGYNSNDEEKQISFMSGVGTVGYTAMHRELEKYLPEEKKSGQTEL